MKSGCNLNSKNGREGRDMYDRSLDEFIVSRSRCLRLVRKFCRVRENEEIEFRRAFTFRRLFLNIPFRKLYAAGWSTAKS